MSVELQRPLASAELEESLGEPFTVMPAGMLLGSVEQRVAAVQEKQVSMLSERVAALERQNMNLIWLTAASLLFSAVGVLTAVIILGRLPR
jgi:hypothetical protein